MRRILSVWLPSWPTQRLRRLTAPQTADREAGESEPAPLATVESVRGMRRLAAVCAHAAALGLRPEQPLAEARAMCPHLVVADADPRADRAALARLAGWCERYTPLAAVDHPDGLWLDITGCAHLLGNEAGLAADLKARLERGGLACRIGIAATPGAAWAVARSATTREDCTILCDGAERAGLSVLPVALLRLDPRTVAGLRRVGLRSIGEMARQPRGELASRYGAATLLRLDQALGGAAEAIAWPRPPTPWEERLAFAEPIGTPEDLARGMTVLAHRLCQRLEAVSCGGLRFAANFMRVDEARPRITIVTALPVRDPTYIAKLLHAKLETIDPGFGVDAIVLTAETTEPLAPPQGKLGDLAAPRETALAASVDEITNRLGEDRQWRAIPAESHIPERAARCAPPLTSAKTAWLGDPPRERPVRLLRPPQLIEAVAPVPDDPPMLFRWRGTTHRVRAADGPERIAPEWWASRNGTGQRDDTVRDYYRVEDMEGARFWIYRAGLMGEGHVPRWYLHGLFG